MTSARKSRKDRIRKSAEVVFGQRVTEVTAPGGSSRASLRFHFKDKTVIGTLRPNFRRTHLEAYVLRALAPHNDDIPQCLGVDGVVMFQSDVGERRLNKELYQVSPEQQIALIAEAIAAIFRIQIAARKTDLHAKLPHLGNNAGWLKNLASGIDTLAPFADDIPSSFDPAAVLQRLTHPGVEFVKWDCRTGNAAIGSDNRLRWFDFEYAGLRHGAEDFAWLIGDESLPIDGPTMAALILDALPADPIGGRHNYMEFLAVYTVFHILQRLALIISESQSRGWLRIERVLDRDDVGVHPKLAGNLCRTGAHFASLSPLTAMLENHFVAAAELFDRILTTGHA